MKKEFDIKKIKAEIRRLQEKRARIDMTLYSLNKLYAKIKVKK